MIAREAAEREAQQTVGNNANDIDIGTYYVTFNIPIAVKKEEGQPLKVLDPVGCYTAERKVIKFGPPIDSYDPDNIPPNLTDYPFGPPSALVENTGEDIPDAPAPAPGAGDTPGAGDAPGAGLDGSG